MIISRTPYRISFFGGGSDFQSYYDSYPGAVLSASIDKYCYVTARKMPPFFPFQSQLTYSKIERFNRADELEHPLVRNILKYLDIEQIQISYDSDIPARSGIGSSSSFAVGLLNSLHALNGERKNKFELATEAIYAERVLCNEAGGIQDQIAAAFGGFNRIDFHKDGFQVHPLPIPQKRIQALNDNLLLYFTGFQRNSYDISEKQNQKTEQNIGTLHKMVSFVEQGVQILRSGSELTDFGRLLDESWQLKKSLEASITNTDIDTLYQKAKNAGATGGKILGAGGGGFLLLYVPADKQEDVKCALHDFLQVPFRFEDSGTSIIYKGGEPN